MTLERLAILIVVLMAAFLTSVGMLLVVLGFLAGKVLAHDIYSGWRMPDQPTLSCCNNTDCRATRAYLDDDGLWRAWDGQRWLIVPPYKMLPADYAGDGRNHLCALNGNVYCFSPTSPRG